MRPEPDPFLIIARFTTNLFRIGDKGGWTFVEVPPDLAPPVTGGWGMTPVVAKVDGREWQTTVWKDKTNRSLLPVPKKVRGSKGHGDSVEIELRMDRARLRAP